MKIALCADEPYPVHATLLRLLRARGHEPVLFGAVATGGEVAWADAAEEAAAAVAAAGFADARVDAPPGRRPAVVARR